LGPLVLLIGGMISAATLYAVLLYAVHVASFSIPVLRPTTGHWSAFDAVRVGFAMGVTNVGLWALAFVFPFALEDARFRALEAQQLRTAAELARLRKHLEPHFMLNTLNAIAGLVTEDPRAARRLLASLGDLLRDSLRDEGEMQPLGEQIDWLRHYAQILEERHAGQLAFAWKVAAETRAALLPRLLLQPLVENAVKHGALGRKNGGKIEVRAEVVGATKLVCTVEDNGLGMPVGKARPGAFGLLSVRRRLALQYAERASFRLETSTAGTRSIVEIPIEETRP
jgi:LytS/YehU family sensor histidine kinase